MNQDETLITVVVTVYNAEKHIRRCLESLLERSECRFDLLVIDDGSHDRSMELCSSMLRDVENARLETIPHRGVAYARNYGLSQVKTKYVLFVDGDDALDPEAIPVLHRIAAERRSDLVVFGFCYESGKGTSYRVSMDRDMELHGKENILVHYTRLWDSGLLYSACNKLFSVDLIRENDLQFKDLDFGEDFEFCRRYLEKCRNISVISQCSYHYTCHTKGSLSTTYRDDLFEIRVQEHLLMEEYFQSLGVLDAAAEEFLARRHIERIVGCVENECSIYSKKTVGEKLAGIRRIVTDENTARCAREAHLSSLKMRILVFLIRRKWVGLTYLAGCVMTICRNWFPGLFMWLKMNR